jgi:hypothetical protein
MSVSFILYPRKLASPFFLFITLYVRFGSRSGSGTGYYSGTRTVMHSGSGSVNAKSYGSCGSGPGSTTVVPVTARVLHDTTSVCPRFRLTESRPSSWSRPANRLSTVSWRLFSGILLSYMQYILYFR